MTTRQLAQPTTQRVRATMRVHPTRERANVTSRRGKLTLKPRLSAPVDRCVRGWIDPRSIPRIDQSLVWAGATSSFGHFRNVSRACYVFTFDPPLPTTCTCANGDMCQRSPVDRHKCVDCHYCFMSHSIYDASRSDLTSDHAPTPHRVNSCLCDVCTTKRAEHAHNLMYDWLHVALQRKY